MRLRNKKTGEITEGTVWIETRLHTKPFDCPSIADLVEYWEDCKEPLIKDKKIRKAVRAWAEANDANVVSICALSGGWGVRYDLEDREGYGSIDLLFKGNAPLGVGNSYTIDELCGEEEE